MEAWGLEGGSQTPELKFLTHIFISSGDRFLPMSFFALEIRLTWTFCRARASQGKHKSEKKWSKVCSQCQQNANREGGPQNTTALDVCAISLILFAKDE